MDQFEARLAAAYEAWHASRGRTPDRFFALYADDIELHSVLEASLFAETGGPYIGKPAALTYFAAIAEAWEMLEAQTDALIAQGDRVVWVGHVTWRNRQTLRIVSGPKIDAWTTREGLAVRFLEMFDSYGCARAMGLIDPPA